MDSVKKASPLRHHPKKTVKMFQKISMCDLWLMPVNFSVKLYATQLLARC